MGLTDPRTLRRLAGEATGGEWVRVTEGHASVDQMGHKVLRELLVPLPDGTPASTDGTYVRTGDGSKNIAFVGNGPRQTENGDWIAAASPDRVLALLDERDRLRSLLAFARSAALSGERWNTDDHRMVDEALGFRAALQESPDDR